MSIPRLEFIDRIFAHYEAPHICIVAKDEELLKKGAMVLFRHEMAGIHLAFVEPDTKIARSSRFDFVYYFGGCGAIGGAGEYGKNAIKDITSWSLNSKKVLSLAIGELNEDKRLEFAVSPMKLTFVSSAIVNVEESENGELVFRILRPAIFGSGETISV